MVDLQLRLKIFFGILVVIIASGTVGFMFIEKLTLADAL
jgi:hypothetical protein